MTRRQVGDGGRLASQQGSGVAHVEAFGKVAGRGDTPQRLIEARQLIGGDAAVGFIGGK